MKIRLFLIIILIILLFDCGKQSNVQPVVDETIYPDLIQKNYRYYIYKNNKKYLYATVELAEFYEKKNYIDCDTIYAEIYNAKGELTTKINAVKGKINKNDKNVTFSENVIFDVVENDLKLYSEEITLDYMQNKLISKGPVSIEKEDGSFIKGDSMESDIKAEITKFEKMIIKYYYDEDDKNE